MKKNLLIIPTLNFLRTVRGLDILFSEILWKLFLKIGISFQNLCYFSATGTLAGQLASETQFLIWIGNQWGLPYPTHGATVRINLDSHVWGKCCNWRPLYTSISLLLTKLFSSLPGDCVASQHLITPPAANELPYKITKISRPAGDP